MEPQSAILTPCLSNTYILVNISIKNCNRYFIATNKSYNYCENIAPGEKKKTCREIGRRLVFENKKIMIPYLLLTINYIIEKQ